MGTPDFLKKDAETPLSDNYLAAGVPLSVTTNFPDLIQIADECFTKAEARPNSAEVRLRLWVDPLGQSTPLWPKPYFRGLGHLVFAGFDAQNSLLIDLRDQWVLGRLTPVLARDRKLWKTVILPMMIATVAASAGSTVLHCACVAWKGSGLLLSGESGSGKSTLSVALAQSRFDFLSDDRIVISSAESGQLAWNLSTHLKLRSDAVKQFPALRSLAPTHDFQGEMIYHLDPAEDLQLTRVRCCSPRWVFFLERGESPEFALAEISPEEAAARLEEGLARETPDAAQRQRRAIRALAGSDCWKLRYGGDPHAVARALRDFIRDGRKNGRGRITKVLSENAGAGAIRRDPLRRFTPTPLDADLPVMGRTIRLETNSHTVVGYAWRGFNRYPASLDSRPAFLWKIVTEGDALMTPPWPLLSAYSHRMLRFVNLGQRSFIAVDLEAREAVGYLSEVMAEDEAGFLGVFLATMFYLTAGSLGLTALSAACVAAGDKGLLVFGEPGSGKTTSAYLSERLGLQFCADQATFLEFQGRSLQAWGEFWPTAFRTDTAQFLPEIADLARPLVHQELTFLSLDKQRTGAGSARSVVPAACIFLERHAADPPRLVSISHGDFSSRLRRFVPFRDESNFEENSGAIFHALSELPSYRLLYGSEPSVAAQFFRSILKSERLMEARS